jgi:hypothetical protein
MKQKWSKQRIIDTIKDMHKQGVDISASNISRNYIPLFTASCSRRYFGSWGAAVRTAGIDYDKVLEAGKERRRDKLTKWTKETVLEEIRKAQSKNLLTTYRDRLALYSAARREYGSWKQALEIAGYRLTKGSHKNANQIFSKDEVSAAAPAAAQESSNVAQAV